MCSSDVEEYFTELHANGKFRTLSCRVAGNLSGRFNEYYENGLMKSDGFYNAGKRIDRWTYYDEDGHMASQGMFFEDQRIGVWMWWSPSGIKTHELCYTCGTADEIISLFSENGGCPENSLVPPVCKPIFLS